METGTSCGGGCFVDTLGTLAIAPYRFVRFYRFMMCSARFSTFNAASLTASLKVGCE
jgi:hypothetical protein